jgi:universal stress protein A
MKILITTDLSEGAKAAFQVARKQAEAFNAELTLLAVVEDPAKAALAYALEFPVSPDKDIQIQLIEKVKSDLEDLSKQYFQGLNIKVVVLTATKATHTEIINYAKENKIDLIVMATHGRTGLSHLLIGSIAERVVRECPCPILTVPALKVN